MSSSKKSRVFVTGANGMLGSYIVRTLLQDGYDVTALIFPSSDTRTIDKLPIKVIEGDITHNLPYANYLADCQYIIHVAASTQVWPRRDQKIWNINQKATLKLADAASKANIQRFIHIGSGSSFTPKASACSGNESVCAPQEGFGLDYIDSKSAVQKDLLGLFEQEGFPVIIINPAYMIGPFDSGPTSGRLILNMMKGGIQPYTSGGKNLVYSGDVARAAVNALHLGRTGQCYIACGENLSYKEINQHVSNSLAIKSFLLKIPHIVVLTAGALLSCIARIRGKAPVMSYTLARMSRTKTYYRTTKAKDELNMPQTPISFAIRSCAHWFIANGYFKTNKSFEGKTVVVSGSTQGVGNALSHALVSRGANVVINGRSEDKAVAMEADFSYAKKNVHYVAADICSEKQCEHLIQAAIHRFGKIDYLINNAGMSSYGELEQNSGDVIRNVFNSNVMGSVYLSKAALPQLKQNEGGLLFISSLAALNGLGGHAIYSAAKVAMISIAQSLKKELENNKVFVGYTCLGFTENDEDKRTLNASGQLEPIPTRPGINPLSKAFVANKLLKQLETEQHRSIHSIMGKAFYAISRISERIANLILTKGYKAEKAFLEKVNALSKDDKTGFEVNRFAFK